MPKVSYQRNFTSFKNNKVDARTLRDEVYTSEQLGYGVISKSLANLSIDFSGRVVTFVFNGELTAAEELVLDNIASNHTGNPPKAEPVPIDALVDRNTNILNVVPTPVGPRWLTWITGSGDKQNAVWPDTGRGTGDRILVKLDGPGDGYANISFIEPVHVHDGQLTWGPSDSWGPDDWLDVGVLTYANQPTPAVDGYGDGYGNCNLVPTGMGFNMIVPADNDGYYNIDLGSGPDDIGTAVPSWALDEDDFGIGYWDVNQMTGKVRPADTPGKGDFNLYDIDLPQGYLMRRVSMGHRHGVLDIDVYKTEWIHPSWHFLLSVHKVTPGAGWCAGWLLTFRRNID